MTIAAYISGGIGPGATVTMFVTRGLDIGEAAAVVPATAARVEWKAPDERLHFSAPRDRMHWRIP